MVVTVVLSLFSLAVSSPVERLDSETTKLIKTLNESADLPAELFEGDIVLSNEQLSIIEGVTKSSNRSRRQAMKDAGYLWGVTNVVIPYSWARGYPNDSREVVRKAMDFWEKNSCVKFAEDPSATDRVEIRHTIGCSSNVGKVGGVQGINLGDGCLNVGTITHELSHTFGMFHVHTRYDRDDYVDIDWTNVGTKNRHNFDMEGPETADVEGIPYEFGSNMHYYQSDYALRQGSPVIYAKPAYKIYQEGMMGRLPTFYDKLAINNHFQCQKRCKTSITCSNGGFQNSNECSSCICPSGWTGATCDQRPSGVSVAVTSTPQRVRFDLGARNVTGGLDYMSKYYYFQAPAGRRVSLTPKVFGTLWSNSCSAMGIDVKFLKDQRPTGLQVCDFRIIYPAIVSETNEMFVEGYTTGGLSVVEMTVSAV